MYVDSIFSKILSHILDSYMIMLKQSTSVDKVDVDYYSSNEHKFSFIVSPL